MVTSMRWLRSAADGVRSASQRIGEVVRIAGDEVERLLAGVEPRQAEQVLDEPFHALRVPRDDRENRRCSSSSTIAVGQRLDVAANRRQRRAQLVRDVGDEVTPDLIGAPQTR